MDDKELYYGLTKEEFEELNAPSTPEEIAASEITAKGRAREEQEKVEVVEKRKPPTPKIKPKKEIPLETPEERAARIERNRQYRIKQEKHQAECDAKLAILEAEKQAEYERKRETAYKQVPLDFLKHCKMTDRELKTFFGFLAFTDKDYKTYVGYEKVAKATSQSRGWLYQPINLLLRKGYIKVFSKENTGVGDETRTKVTRKAIFFPKEKWKKVEFQSKAVVRFPIVFLKYHLGNMTGREFQVFMALLAFGEGATDVMVSNSEIHEKIGGSIKGIERAIKDLKEKGYIKDIGADGHTKLRRLFFLPKIKAKDNKIEFVCPGKEFGSVFCLSFQRYEFCENCDLHHACWSAHLDMLNAESAAQVKAKKAAKKLARNANGL